MPIHKYRLLRTDIKSRFKHVFEALRLDQMVHGRKIIVTQDVMIQSRSICTMHNESYDDKYALSKLTLDQIVPSNVSRSFRVGCSQAI
jgi:hypothetical protein